MHKARYFRSSFTSLLAFLMLTPMALADEPPPPPPEPGEEQPETPPSPGPAPLSPQNPPPQNPAPAPEEPTSAEEPMMEEGPDPSRPPPPKKGAVWGIVTDEATKEPIIEAQISVVGTKIKTLSDVDGRFRLELPPGIYELRIFYELYKAQRVQNLRITVGNIERVDVALAGDKTAEDVVVIEAEPDRSSATAQILIRKNAATVGDAVSAQEIAKSPDRNAADAARRVVGASVVGSKYVFVRGLGERYTNSLLNGAPLPSPEPDRQAVPLDLFPTLILSDLTIVKTFSPDMPGDFTGGSVRINTRELPDKFSVQAQLSLGLNSESTFKDRLSYRGSSLDWLGIDAGARKLPSDIPNYKTVFPTFNPDQVTLKFPREQLDAWGRSLNSYMSTTRSFNLPNMSGNVALGDTLRFGNQRLGYSAALTYGRKFTIRQDEIIRTYTIDINVSENVRPLNDYRAETGLDQVSWGSYAGLSYTPHPDHKISATGLYSRSSDNEAREIQGFNEEAGAVIRDTRLRFVSRVLGFGQLMGDHTLPFFNKTNVRWNLSYAQASADEPDTRENVYSQETSGWAWNEGTLSGLHFFAAQQEENMGGGMDITIPLLNALKLKTGGLFNLRERQFDARRFRFRKRAGVSPEVFRQEADLLFTNENIGPVLELEEYTRPNDSYVADTKLFSAYILSDAALDKRLRVVLGARIESSVQQIDSFDPFAADLTRLTSSLDRNDLLPSLSLIATLSDSLNLRASITKTVARPQLRELAPFTFTDYFGAREIQGNPNLDRSQILNADLRLEWFPTLNEVLAASFFYKKFDKPIEQIIIPSNKGIISYQNAKGAQNAGIELEARKNLGFAHPALNPFGLVANVAIVYSRVELDKSLGISVQTNTERPLSGQSPYVINAGLDYERESTGTRLRLLYNVFGERIDAVGALGLPDVYEQPRHQVDLTIAQRIKERFDIKLSLENLLFQQVRFTQGTAEDGSEGVVSAFSPGMTGTLSLSLRN